MNADDGMSENHDAGRKNEDESLCHDTAAKMMMKMAHDHEPTNGNDRGMSDALGTGRDPRGKLAGGLKKRSSFARRKRNNTPVMKKSSRSARWKKRGIE